MTKNDPILVTGSDGFIGKNLIVGLQEQGYKNISTFSRKNSLKDLNKLVSNSRIIFHLAGENRTNNKKDFQKNNADLTDRISKLVLRNHQPCHVIFTSSTQATNKSPYGISKLKAEKLLTSSLKETIHRASILRLPGVFGKWSKPNYNSVVATFCYNIARGNPITVNDKETILRLLYIDDLLSQFMVLLTKKKAGIYLPKIKNIYSIKLSKLEEILNSFKSKERVNILKFPTSKGITHALYSTFISFLPSTSFVSPLKLNRDERGDFFEAFKNNDFGQVSFFTCNPRHSRGNHYHHSKVEQFVVLQGTAEFEFKDLSSKKKFKKIIHGNKPALISTIPGWSHKITNIGSTQLIGAIWANELFDPSKPDTYYNEV